MSPQIGNKYISKKMKQPKKAKNTSYPVLKKEYADAILKKPALMAKMMEQSGGKNWRTIERWCKDRHRYLTYPDMLALISDGLKVEKSELLTKAA